MTLRRAIAIVLLLFALGVVAQRAAASGHCGDPDDHPVYFLRCQWHDTNGRIDGLERENAALRDRIALLEARPPAGLSRHDVWQLARDAAWSVLVEQKVVKP